MSKNAKGKTKTAKGAKESETAKGLKEFKKRDEDGIRLATYQRFREGIHYESQEQDQTTALIEFAQHCHKIHRSGRPPKYPELEEFLGVIDAYWCILNEKNANGIKIIPDVEGFCCFAGICRDTLNEWERSRTPDFQEIIKTLKNMMAYTKKQLALSGKIPPIVFATDFNNNHNYTQKQELHVMANNPLGDIKDVNELKARYLNAAPEADYVVVDE